MVTPSPAIALSTLGYERELERRIDDIGRLLALPGVAYLHVDIMRKPFIPAGDRYSEERIHALYSRFGDDVSFDFHLMVRNPSDLIAYIASIVPKERRDRHIITIHREAYRNEEHPFGGRKEIDYLDPPTKDDAIRRMCLAVDVAAADRIHKRLREIRELGFKAGLALEPGTALDTVTPEFAGHLDLLLLMSVPSGAGGQAYDHQTTWKLTRARHLFRPRFPDLLLQVDGGINAETFPAIAHAGADIVVIGSYLTDAKDPEAAVRALGK